MRRAVRATRTGISECCARRTNQPGRALRPGLFLDTRIAAWPGPALWPGLTLVTHDANLATRPRPGLQPFRAGLTLHADDASLTARP